MKNALLMFANDIVLLANSPSELQTTINKVSDWCERWRLFINTTKTHVIHFRASQTHITFRCRNKVIEKLDRVSYLGMEMNEHVNLEIIANRLIYAASRALGALTAKYYQTKGMTFEVYQIIYKTCVSPIMDYASEVWGYKNTPNLKQYNIKQ